MRKHSSQSGFSLIEVIIVVTLIAFVYTVALPQFGMRSQTEIANKLNQLASDVRSAYDVAVLSKKTYRMVFMLSTGEYWLEEADRPDVYLGNERVGHDATEDEEKDELVVFEDKIKEYQDLAGQAVVDQEKDKEIPPTSPVVTARDRLRKAKWTRVETLEWSVRTLSPVLVVKDMQSEHHGQKQERAELGDKGRAMIYFFPSGYVQRAVLHLSLMKGDGPDDDAPSYTIVTQPFQGTADVLDTYQEIDVHDDREEG